MLPSGENTLTHAKRNALINLSLVQILIDLNPLTAYNIILN